MPEALILFCPVCCSNIDVEATDGDTVEATCNHCNQTFKLVVDVNRINTHSIH